MTATDALLMDLGTIQAIWLAHYRLGRATDKSRAAFLAKVVRRLARP